LLDVQLKDMDFLQIDQALFFYYQHIVTFSGKPK